MAAVRKLTATERAERLGKANLIPLILSMSAPAIVGNMSNTLYNIISRIYLGRFVGSAAMGAMGVIFPLNNLTTAMSVMLTIGGAAQVSMSLGKGDKKKSDSVFTNIFAFALVVSTVFAFTYFFFAEQLIQMCGANPTDAVFQPAVIYLRISAFGHIFQLLNQSAACVIRAEGNTLYSMYVSISGNVMNIILGAVFIVWLQLGIQGAAYATMLSQFTGMCLSFVYFIQKKSVVRWGGIKSINIKTILLILSTGIAPAIFQGLSFVTNILINNSLRIYATGLTIMSGTSEITVGFDIAVSAMAVIATCENIALSFIMGFNNGISSIISYNYGAKNYKRVMKTSLIGQALASSIAIIVWLLMMLTPNTLFSIFVSTKDIAVLQYGAYAIHKNKLFMFFLGFQTLASMYYSAIGKPHWATLVSLSRNGLFLIPALLILPRVLGLDGVLYSTSASDLCSAIVVGFLYFRGMADLRKKEREQKELMLPKDIPDKVPIEATVGAVKK
jgi:putative MATE family efflux protein